MTAARRLAAIRSPGNDKGRDPRRQRMRCTKIALLMFGAGLVLGLVVIAFELDPLERAASWLMALGIAAIPIGILVDWRRAAKPAPPPAPKQRGKPRAHRASPAARRRPRKPARAKG